jgi:hypothetical protein
MVLSLGAGCPADDTPSLRDAGSLDDSRPDEGESCEQLIEQVDSLASRAGSCVEGQACVIANGEDLAGPGNCLEAFQCARAYAASVDLADLTREATRLADAYRARPCTSCVIARCAPLEYAECIEGRCQKATRPSSLQACESARQDACPEGELCYLSYSCGPVAGECTEPEPGDRQCHRDCGADRTCGPGEVCTDVSNFEGGGDVAWGRSLCLAANSP